jgi:methionine-rich copper-binding protein CopC
MRKHLLATFALVPAALWLTGSAAAANPPQLRSSSPAAEAILDGRNLQYVVHFDAPIDHAASRLEISQDGTLVESLHPLLDSAPTVLFGSGKALPPGHYTLHWHVGAATGGDVSDGDIPFSVQP